MRKLGKKDIEKTKNTTVSIKLIDLLLLLEQIHNGVDNVKPLDLYNLFHGKQSKEINNAAKYINLTKRMVLDIINNELQEPIKLQEFYSLDAVKVFDSIHTRLKH